MAKPFLLLLPVLLGITLLLSTFAAAAQNSNDEAVKDLLFDGWNNIQKGLNSFQENRFDDNSRKAITNAKGRWKDLLQQKPEYRPQITPLIDLADRLINVPTALLSAAEYKQIQQTIEKNYFALGFSKKLTPKAKDLLINFDHNNLEQAKQDGKALKYLPIVGYIHNEFEQFYRLLISDNKFKIKMEKIARVLFALGFFEKENELVEKARAIMKKIQPISPTDSRLHRDYRHCQILNNEKKIYKKWVKTCINKIHAQFRACNYQQAEQQLNDTFVWLSDNVHNEKQRQWLQTAMFFTQYQDSLNDTAVMQVLYRLQWQLGKWYKKQSNLQKASDAYRLATHTLQRLRDTNLPDEAKPTQSVLKQIYYGLIDTLFKRYEYQQKQQYLEEIVKTAEILKQAELENYFQDECLVKGDETRIDEQLKEIKTANKTAIFYPIVFPKQEDLTEENFSDRMVELLLIQPHSKKKIKWLTLQHSSNIRHLNEWVNLFRQELEDPAMNVSSNRIRQYGQELHNLLIKPLETHTSHIDTLVFVPDGALRTIPLVVLFDGQKFVLEKHYAVATIPGLTLTKVARDFSPKNLRILLAGISMDKPVKIDNMSFGTLSQTKNALDDIEKLSYSARKIINFKIHSLKNEMYSTWPYNIMHLHTHATFKKWGEKYLSFFLTQELLDDPKNLLEKCGLSSDNNKKTDENHKPYKNQCLTMERLEEIFSIGERRNSPIELLTLSACETAKGDEQAALGLAGVAFKSGARSVLASLWPVDEKFTSELMPIFYEKYLKDNKSKIQALQIAQQKIMKKANHPKYWAPFILIGNWFK